MLDIQEAIQSDLRILVDNNKDSKIPLDENKLPSFLAGSYYVDTNLDDLMSSLQFMWSNDIQQKKIVALSQSFGVGKTKLLIELAAGSAFNLVVPIRFNFANNIWRALLQDISELHEAKEDSVDYQNDCISLFKAVLYAFIQAALDVKEFNKKVELDSRLLSFYILINPNFIELVVHHYQLFKKDNLVKIGDKLAQVGKIVLGMDEVHLLLGKLPNYFHSFSRKDPKDLVYLLKLVLKDQLDRTVFATLLTSTYFRIWSILEMNESPYTRNIIKRASPNVIFTISQIITGLNHYFNFEFKLEEFKKELDTLVGRPYFLLTFLEQLAYLKINLVTKDQFNDCLGKCLLELNQRIDSSFKNAKQKNIAVETETTLNLFNILFYTCKFNNSTLKLKQNNIVIEAINNGIATLDSDHSGLRIVEKLIVENILKSNLDINTSYKVLHGLIKSSAILDSSNNKSKGVHMERCLAIWLMNKFPQIPQQAANENDLDRDLVHSLKDCLVFPSSDSNKTTSDIAFEVDGIITLLQSKCLQKSLNYSSFINCLKSINHPTILNATFMQTKRIVFSFSGFSSEVWARVKLHNNNIPDHPIELLDRDSLLEYYKSPYLRELLTHFENEISHFEMQVKPTELFDKPTWDTLSTTRKKSIPMDLIKQYATQLGIKLTNSKKYKNKATLLSEIESLLMSDFNKELMLINKRINNEPTPDKKRLKV